MGFLLAFCVIDELAVSVSTARYESSLLFWSWFDASRNRFDSANTALDQQDQITELFFLSPKGGGWEEGGGRLCIFRYREHGVHELQTALGRSKQIKSDQTYSSYPLMGGRATDI